MRTPILPGSVRAAISLASGSRGVTVTLRPVWRPTARSSSVAAQPARSRSTALEQHPVFSADQGDLGSLEASLSSLLSSTGAGGRWTLTSSGEGLERTFKFKTFTKTWDFMTAVSLQCKLKNHHPEWSNVFNTTFIRWTTHNPKGLSAKDLELAAICDSLARGFGEIPEEPQSCELKGLANEVTSSSGDCCAPKKAS